MLAAPAHASSPAARRPPSFGDAEEATPTAASRAAMKQLSAERLDRYVTYWKTVAERSQQAADGEADKPINKQRDLLKVYRSIRAQVRGKSGLTESEIHSLDMAVETYFKYLSLGRRRPVCATGESAEGVAALRAQAKAESDAREQRFAQDFGQEPAKLLAERESALRDASSARETYGN